MPGRSNVEIKQLGRNFNGSVDSIYFKLNYSNYQQKIIKLKKNNQLSMDNLRIKLFLLTTSLKYWIKWSQGWNGHQKFIRISAFLMLLYVSKESYRFYANPRNVVLYDENTGKKYNTTVAEFEKIKAEQKRYKDFKEFRLKVLNKTQQKIKE